MSLDARDGETLSLSWAKRRHALLTTRRCRSLSLLLVIFCLLVDRSLLKHGSDTESVSWGEAEGNATGRKCRRGGGSGRSGPLNLSPRAGCARSLFAGGISGGSGF